jgi:hypothetical protein
MAVELLVIRNSGSGQNPAAGGRGVLPLAGRWNPEYCGPLDGSSWGAKEEQVMLFYKHFSHLFFKIRADATHILMQRGGYGPRFFYFLPSCSLTAASSTIGMTRELAAI